MGNKIDLNRLRGAQHTVKLLVDLEDNGTKQKETIRIVYRGRSLQEGPEIEAKLEQIDDEREKLIEALCMTVIELPDIVDDGAPVKPDRDFFAGLDTYFLHRMNQAISDDRQGKVLA
jgi:hypothetical protein